MHHHDTLISPADEYPVHQTPDGRQHHGRAMLAQLIISESWPYGFKDLFDLAP